MVVLLTGGTGFIGHRLAARLRQCGHRVVETRRHDSGSRGDVVKADFTCDLEAGAWIPRLAGIDAVINAVGILRERGRQTFDAIHTRAPQALFAACAAAGVRRVVQISALGADDGTTGYFVSKRRADDSLADLPLDWTIVQPSIVYGPGGTSATLFRMLASLPLIPLPGRGEQRVQPIHVDDLVEAIVNLLEGEETVRQRVALAGPQPLILREFVQQLRSALGLGAAHFVSIPIRWVRLAASAAGRLPWSLLDRETLSMLERGNTADPQPTRRLLRRNPRPVTAFVPRENAAAIAAHARLQWLLPLLRWSIALVWIWSGVVSLGLYPPESSYRLLARTGVTGPMAPLLLYGAALLDLGIGLAILAMRRRRMLWLVQIALIIAYTIIITVKLPEYWLHPYGPVLKNLPLLAAIYLLYSLEDRTDS